MRGTQRRSALAPTACCVAKAYDAAFMFRRLTSTTVGKVDSMLLILALLLVLILFGAGFAVHLLWVAAVIFAIVWLVGFAIGRGEGAGRHRFYRW